MTNLAIINKKRECVDLLIQDIKNFGCFVLFEYQGIKVNDLTELRVELNKINSMIKVCPNNILKRTFESMNYNELVDLSKYSKALLLSPKDSLESIKILFNFTKTNKFLKIIKGFIDDKIISYESIAELATLTSKEHLLSMLSSGMMSMLKELAIGLNMIANKEK